MAGYPAVTFCSYALTHAVYQNGVVGTCGTVAINTVLVGEADVMSATVKERLSVPESIESILVGYGVRSAAIGVAAKTEHGAFAGVVQVGGEKKPVRFAGIRVPSAGLSIPVRWAEACRIEGGTMPDLRLLRCFPVREYRVGGH